MTIEPWMYCLRAGVDAGLWSKDTTEHLEPLPTLPAEAFHELAFTTSHVCFEQLRQIADHCDFTLDEMAAMIYHRGLMLYCDRRRSLGKELQLSQEPAVQEQGRADRMSAQRKQWRQSRT